MTAAKESHLNTEQRFIPRSSDSRPMLEIAENEDDAEIRHKYRTFLLDQRVAKSDWVSKLELDTVERMVQSDLAANGGNRIKVLVLFGSLRSR